MFKRLISDLEQINLALVYFRDFSDGGGGGWVFKELFHSRLFVINQYGSFVQKSHENISILYSGRLIQVQ